MKDESKKIEQKKSEQTQAIQIDPNASVIEFSAVVQLANVDVLSSMSGGDETKAQHTSKHGNGDTSVTNITDLSKFIERSSKSDLLEAQVRLVTLFVTEAKFLESEMNKLIKVLYSKHPDSKPYLLKMKKLLQDHANIEKALEDVKKAS